MGKDNPINKGVKPPNINSAFLLSNTIKTCDLFSLDSTQVILRVRRVLVTPMDHSTSQFRHNKLWGYLIHRRLTQYNTFI